MADPAESAEICHSLRRTFSACGEFVANLAGPSIHELQDWPRFLWDHRVLAEPLAAVRHRLFQTAKVCILNNSLWLKSTETIAESIKQ